MVCCFGRQGPEVDPEVNPEVGLGSVEGDGPVEGVGVGTLDAGAVEVGATGVGSPVADFPDRVVVGPDGRVDPVVVADGLTVGSGASAGSVAISRATASSTRRASSSRSSPDPRALTTAALSARRR